LADRPTILFVALIQWDYSPFRSSSYGLGISYGLMAHKYAIPALVAWLRENGCEGHYIWVGDNEKDDVAAVLNAIDEFKPDAVGFSLCTDEMISNYRIISQLKESHPNLPVIVGGPHVSALPEHTLRNFPLIDYIVVAEGERTLTELLSRLASGQKAAEMREVDGLGFRDESGEIVITSPRERIRDINILPNPAYDVLLTPDSRTNEGSLLPMIFSYGCPFYCTFCGADHGHYRFIDPGRAVDRIEWAAREFGFDYFCFCDSFWPPSAKWLGEFCDKLESRGLKVKFHFETRVGVHSLEELRRLRRIGATAIAVGVESGDAGVLKRIKKGITPDMARRTFAALHKAGLFSRGFFMFGNRGENRETIAASVKLMKELNPSVVTISTHRPFPGTEDFDLLADDEKDWWMKGDEKGRWWAGGELPSICDLSPTELLLLAREAELRYPLRWGYLWRNVIDGNLPREFRRVCRIVFMLNLRKVALGTAERYAIFRALIRGIKSIVKRS
jgi:radical SAM superfamily enzyme YgiQ (UPF0313 family)